jgi:hypothetical protein
MAAQPAPLYGTNAALARRLAMKKQLEKIPAAVSRGDFV